MTASPELLDGVGGAVGRGTWFTDGTAAHPTVVIGSQAAELLGITKPGRHVIIGDTQYLVIGILKPVPLAADLDVAALLGETQERLTESPVHPTTAYMRVNEDRDEEVRSLIARTIQPQSPTDVEVTRPSDALAAKQAADQAFTGLLVGLGSVALLVVGIGVANTMVISVLEGHREIGLRRALDATRSHIRTQFLAEALLLSLLGGIAGVVLGLGVTAAFAVSKGWPVSVPPGVFAAGLAATVLIGAVAGLWPAVRAARTPPTEALQS